MNTDDMFYNPRFPLANKYPAEWIIDNSMGPNTLWLTEWLSEALRLEPGMRVLDLGCGRALSSIFLAKEFGVQVWAYDLWCSPSENWARVKQHGLQNQVFPVQGDARTLPFPESFFDAVVCIDSYIYYGTDDLYLNYLQTFVREGAQLGIVIPGLMKEFEQGVPDHLTDFWGQDCWSWHRISWWNQLWQRTGLVDIQVADTMPDGCNLYVQWKEAQDAIGKNPWPQDTQILKRDAGEYVGFLRMVAAKPD